MKQQQNDNSNDSKSQDSSTTTTGTGWFSSGIETATKDATPAHQEDNFVAAIRTPIENWEPSWIASSAHGSAIVALECHVVGSNNSNDQDYSLQQQQRPPPPALLLVIRNPKSSSIINKVTAATTTDKNNNNNNQEETSGDETTPVVVAVGGLRMERIQTATEYCYNRRHSYYYDSSQPHWTVLSPSMFCAMTGFLPDLDYLDRRLQSELDMNDFIYQDNDNNSMMMMMDDEEDVSFFGSSSSGTTTTTPGTTITTNRLDIAKVAYLVGQWTREYLELSDRPLGIQALFLGWTTTTTPVARRSNHHNNDNKNKKKGTRGKTTSLLHLYTTDPSGQVRSWNGGAAVIGTYSYSLRRRLHQSLQQQQRYRWSRMMMNRTPSSSSSSGQPPQEQRINDDDHTKETTTTSCHLPLLLSPRHALEVALQALFPLFEETPPPQDQQEQQQSEPSVTAVAHDEETTMMTSGYEAILVWQDGSTRLVGHVDPAQIRDYWQQFLVSQRQQQQQQPPSPQHEQQQE